ncbi:MAG: hypothetical protein IK139_06380 [Lachnospiraceae bacterium]|nr:hypothetical protein [Lachnospiraceae bacterium]
MRQNKSKAKKLKSLTAALLLLAGLILSGAGIFAKPAVIMDPAAHPVYQPVDARAVVSSFNKDRQAALEKYNKNYYVFYGVINKKNDDKDEFLIGRPADSDVTITCKTSSAEVSRTAKECSIGEKVKVYGKFEVDFITGRLCVNTDRIEVMTGKEEPVPDENVYILKSGRQIKRSDMKLRKIGDTGFSYYIPREMEAIEHDIAAEGIGAIDGYQYCFNERDNRAYAEQLFVCYFDKNTLVELNDRSSNRLIEEAIIRDIWKKDSINRFPLTRIKTGYGPEYIYYRDTYEKDLGIDIYQTEMIFEEKGDGIILYLYIYKDKPYSIDDVMLTLRFAR